MTDAVWTYLFLCGTAFVAGVMNSVAGGGTLLTFPALNAALRKLMADDAAAVFANATSTVALVPGSFAGALAYRAELAECRAVVVRMLPPSVAGGLLGAWLATIHDKLFADLVPWLVLTAAVLFLLQQPLKAWLNKHRPDHAPGPVGRAGLILFQLLVAVYGGYFGAGIGILMLTALGLMGVGDIHRMNAVKTVLAAAINGASVVVFVAKGKVQWEYAAAMAVAAVLGGYLGARVARRLPARLVRVVVIVIGFGLAAHYFAKRYF